MSRRIAAWLVAAVVLGTAASALGVVGYFVAKSKEVAPSTVVPTTATGASASPSRSRARAAVVERSAASVETSSAQEPGEVPVASRAVAAQPTAASAKPQPTTEERVDVPTAAFDLESEPTMAAEMFQLANEARRQGSTALAIRRYRELQRRFSSSAEAHLSYVSLGKVLQLSGDSAAAVQEFSRYLARSGALEEEALVGRAEGLATLGRSADELSTWQRLLARFPGSVYAGRARERLAALGVQNRQ